jgi:sugar transferase (PEP-CTERM/EpsH1 system associated)
MKLFVLLSRIPYPLEKGDKLRAYHQVKLLAEKHEVHLCCLTDAIPHPEARKELEKICDEVTILRLNRLLIIWRMFLAFFSDKPFQVHYFYQWRIHRQIERLIQTVKPDHIYCQLIRTTEYVKNLHTIPKTLDYMDAFNKGMDRKIKDARWHSKWFLSKESQRLVAYENLIFDYFENHTIISAQDRKLIFHPDREKIKVIPNGVDFNFFKPQKKEKKYDILFTGNMSYPPNVNSALYLIDEIFPLLQQEYPNIKLLIAGVKPHRSLLERASEQVVVSGWMEDIRDAYAESKIFVAPMLIGTGLQNKLLEAMSMELPCITSPLANNALGGEPGKHLLVSKSTKEYAEAISHLLQNNEEAQQIGKSGGAWVRENYNWRATVEQLEQLLQS